MAKKETKKELTNLRNKNLRNKNLRNKNIESDFNRQFHTCEPPVKIKETLLIQSKKTSLDKFKINKFLRKLPELAPIISSQLPQLNPGRGRIPIIRSPRWNAVALFCNINTASRPSDYATTTVTDVKDWMDEGVSPSNPTIKEFTYDYWNTLSYGNLKFSIEVVRDTGNEPIIPSISPTNNDPHNYPDIAEKILRANPEGVWQAGGSVIMDGKRFIPCVFVVHKYWSGAWAWLNWGLEFNSGGYTYLVGDFTHIPLDLTQTNITGGYKVRNWAHPLFHEFAHTFIEGPDLYGPGGCTGYWDILGDYLSAGVMSESCSLFKERLGWIRFKDVINGLNVPRRSLNLSPYSSTGEAYKIVPDPTNNPYEYFLLEYRKSIGTEPHIPDGGLVGEGLLIIHINERLGVWSKPWMLREAPLFDPEYADYSDFGEALWHGNAQKDQFKVLYPTSTNDRFTPSSTPNSNFYGNRPSGLSIENIRISGGICYFDIEINGISRIGWNVKNEDRGLPGRFSSTSSSIGQEIFLRHHNTVSLLKQQGGQIFVKSKQEGWINGWNLGRDNREIVGDFDGDGRDEIFVRSPNWAGIFKYYTNKFRCDAIQYDWIDGWNLGSDNWELAADLDGNGRDEIYIRSPKWAGVIGYHRGNFQLKYIVHDKIGNWRLGHDNKEYIGRFTQNRRDEILIKSPEWLGLIEWNDSTQSLQLKQIQHDRIDSWNLGGNDNIYIADLDGDGMDEIYIRSDEWAGVLKWDGNKFKVLWMIHQFILHITGDETRKIKLTPGDMSYSGKFFDTKDGIIHRKDGRIGMLIWEDDQLQVRFKLDDRRLGSWRLSNTDKFILGDFHKVGVEGHAYNGTTSEVLPYDHITNNLTDIFIHNGWGTGLVGLNYVPTDFSDPNWRGTEWGLIWIQDRFLVKN